MDNRQKSSASKKQQHSKSDSGGQPHFENSSQKIRNKEPEFKPPDAIKDSENMKRPKSNMNANDRPGSKNAKKKKNTSWLVSSRDKLLDKWDSFSKKTKIITLLVACLVVIGLGVGVYALVFNKKPVEVPVIVPEPEPEPEPTTEISNLTGLEVPIGVNERPVIGVMIENSPDARPQSGLDKAGVVFEAVAEGGITRFLALYLDDQPKNVGPVRSARPYYINWLLSFDASYGHAGGSGEALSLIRSLGVKDLDQFANPNSYQRVSNRYAPHNLYTGIDQLTSLAKSKGHSKSKFTGFERKAEEKPEDEQIPQETEQAEPKEEVKSLAAKSIAMDISGELYNISYKYDLKTNSYLRKMAGVAHNDEKTGKQLSPKVVIALVTEKGIAPNGIHTTYRTIGTGKALIFQDGQVQVGTWSKTSNKSALIFKDTKGKLLKLNPGQTWITAVGNTSAVTYKP